MGDLEHVSILLQSLQAQYPKPRNTQSNMPLKDSRNARVCVSTPYGSRHAVLITNPSDLRCIHVAFSLSIYMLSPPHVSAKSTLCKVLNLVLMTDDLIQLLPETAAPALPHTRVCSLPNNALVLFLGRETVYFSS